MPFTWIGETPRPYEPRAVDPMARVTATAGVAAARPPGPEAPGERAGAPAEARRAYAAPEGGLVRSFQPALTAGQIMTSPVLTITRNAFVAAARELIRQRRIRHLPVVTEGGRLAGMVSDRYLLGVPPHFLTVGDIMSTAVLTATPDTEIRDVAGVMIAEGIGCLPIVDDERHPVGILTTTDILRCLVRRAPVDLWA